MIFLAPLAHLPVERTPYGGASYAWRSRQNQIDHRSRFLGFFPVRNVNGFWLALGRCCCLARRRPVHAGLQVSRGPGPRHGRPQPHGVSVALTPRRVVPACPTFPVFFFSPIAHGVGVAPLHTAAAAPLQHLTRPCLLHTDRYFPGTVAWVHHYTGVVYHGGTTTTVPAPLDQFPLFLRQ